MTKLALSSKHFDQLQDLVEKKIETLPFELVDRAICEHVENGWVQLIPYSSISCYDPTNGDLKFVAYQRSEGTGEQRLVNATSVGFGGHVDTVDDLTCTRMEELEDGRTVYHMSTMDLLTTALATARREWVEEIGFDPIEEFGVGAANTVRFTFFRDPDETNEVGKVHCGVLIPLCVTPEQMAEVFTKAKLQETEVKDLSELVIGAGRILMSFDVSEVASTIIIRMVEEHKLENWSVQVISQTLLEYFELMRSHVSYADIIEAVKKNVGLMRQQQIEAQQAQEQLAAAQAQAQADEAAGIQDVEVKETAESQTDAEVQATQA